jgi:peptidyl-prolyl cis-trans isomerase A (cyclophilin A)
MALPTRFAPLLAFLFATGCTAELKEENNELTAMVGKVQRELAAKDTEIAQLKLAAKDAEDNAKRASTAKSVGLVAGEEMWAKFETTMGEILCKLEPEKAPLTVANFVGLAEGTKGFKHPKTNQQMTDTPYYDGVIFHRVIPGFMIQTGDPTGTGRGGPGFTIQDEFHPDLRHKPGTLSMANVGRPNSGGGQFFITEVATAHLDDKHSVFGYCDPLALVTKMTKVEKAKSKRGPASRPLKDIVITKLSIHRGGRP